MDNRWWLYQRERFPVLIHGAFVAAMSAAAVVYSSIARGAGTFPGVWTFVVVFICTLLFFFQLRVADEFKDYETDAAHRPYRPVPRGLVKLSELRNAALTAAVVQLGLTAWLSPKLLVVLAFVWTYMMLMTAEFFAPRWLKARPALYLASHMMIMPLIYLFATAADWWVSGTRPPEGLGFFLGMGFFNGVVFELGRKIRSPAEEEKGVETYSVLWGRERAAVAWMAAVMLTTACALAAARRMHIVVPASVLISVLFIGAVITAARFIRTPAAGGGKRIEQYAGIWTLLLHATLAGAAVQLL